MRFLSADKVFDGKDYLPEGIVLALNEKGVLEDILPANAIENGKVEKVKGTITPGFINAHCHLELSHLKGKIPQSTGLPGFAKTVIRERNADPAFISEKMKSADKEMWSNGIVAVGDISNTDQSFETKSKSELYYHTFIELIGLKPENAQLIFDKGLVLLEKLKSLHLQGSLAPHAPYSTSRELIKQIALHNSENKHSFSIHNQESDEERKFFFGEENDFEELFRFLSLDLSWFVSPKTSSLKYYGDSLSDVPSLLVHNTFSDKSDRESVQCKDVYWCFCPGANHYIEGRLPDFSLFTDSKNKICIGTDSLASNSQLDVIAEANLILKNSNAFSKEDILRALTLNGSKALGVSDKFGQLITGKNAGLNLLETSDPTIRFIKKIS